MRRLKKRKIVVVGGTAAGTSAAIRAREIYPEWDIVLVEKRNYLGLASCSLYHHIGGYWEYGRKLSRSPADFMNQWGVEVISGTQAVSVIGRHRSIVLENGVTGDRSDLEFDKLIICTGTVPRVPEVIPSNRNGFFALHSREDVEEIEHWMETDNEKQALILGAGAKAPGLVENLLNKGYRVRVLENGERPFACLEPEIAGKLLESMRGKGVSIHLGVKEYRFLTDGERIREVEIEGSSEPVSLVIYSCGVIPATSWLVGSGVIMDENGYIRVSKYLKTSERDIFAAGDCILREDAVRGEKFFAARADWSVIEGRLAAENLFQDKIERRPVVKGIALSFEKTWYVSAGIFEEEKSGRVDEEDRVVGFVSGRDKSGVLPEGEDMYLKGICSRRRGRLLGLSGTGPVGIVRRINLGTLLIEKKAHVEELGTMDLIYNPELGPVQDPLHILGHILTAELKRREGLTSPLAAMKQFREEGVFVLALPTADLSGGECPRAASLVKVYAREIIRIKETDEVLEEIERSDRERNYMLIDRDGRQAGRALTELGRRRKGKLKALSGGMKSLEYLLIGLGSPGGVTQTGG